MRFTIIYIRTILKGFTLGVRIVQQLDGNLKTALSLYQDLRHGPYCVTTDQRSMVTQAANRVTRLLDEQRDAKSNKPALKTIRRDRGH